MRALRGLKRESLASPFMFVSERGVPFTPAGFGRMIKRLGESAGLMIKRLLWEQEAGGSNPSAPTARSV
jgi:hypothetical protein